MTLKVPKSQIDEAGFAALVDAHAAALTAHDAHMRNVAAEPDKKPEERTYEAYPAPVAHPLVDAAVRRAGNGVFVSDYEIVDDGPTAEELFSAKKVELLGAAGAAEAAARDSVIPSGKVRLQTILYNDAFLKKPEDRDDADRAAIDAQNGYIKRLDAINRHGAMMHAEIEDLTAETVDGWTMKEFPR